MESSEFMEAVCKIVGGGPTADFLQHQILEMCGYSLSCLCHALSLKHSIFVSNISFYVLVQTQPWKFLGIFGLFFSCWTLPLMLSPGRRQRESNVKMWGIYRKLWWTCGFWVSATFCLPVTCPHSDTPHKAWQELHLIISNLGSITHAGSVCPVILASTLHPRELNVQLITLPWRTHSRRYPTSINALICRKQGYNYQVDGWRFSKSRERRLPCGGGYFHSSPKARGIRHCRCCINRSWRLVMRSKVEWKIL